MIVFAVKGLRIRIHPSMLAMMALAALLTGAQSVIAAVISVAAHEAGHAVAAKLAGARIAEIELMPFGAAARIDDMHNLKPASAVAVALAGPALSGLACALSGAFDGEWAFLFQRINLTIAAFNLLPGLPLDGGRALCRLLGCKLGARRATGIGIAIGRGLAVAMLVIAATGAAVTGRINVMYIMSAAYMLMSHKRERLAAGGSLLLGMLDRDIWMESQGALPVKWLAAREDTPLDKLLADFRQGFVHRVAVYGEDMKLSGVVEESMILKTALNAKPTRAGDLLQR